MMLAHRLALAVALYVRRNASPALNAAASERRSLALTRSARDWRRVGGDLRGMWSYRDLFLLGAAFLLLETLVSLWTVHWQLIVGAIFMICVLFFPAGIWGTLISRGKP